MQSCNAKQQAVLEASRDDRDEDDEFIDPFAHLNDGTPEDLQRLKLLFAWTPPQLDRRMH